MECKHCGAICKLSKILCNSCAHKALQVLPSDPRERIHIYRILIEEFDNPVTKWAAEQLMADDADILEEEMTGSIFNERDT